MKMPAIFRSRPTEVQTSHELRSISLTDKAIIDWLKNGDDTCVSEEKALSIPAVKASVQLVSQTTSALPFHLFTKRPDGSRLRATDKDQLTRLISGYVNDNYLTTSDWLKWVVTRMLLEGRAITYIERNAAGRVTNFWPQKLADITVKSDSKGRIWYIRADGQTFETYEVLDFIYQPGAEPHTHRSPIDLASAAISQWHAIERFGTALFANGGVSPVIATITASSPEAFAKSREELARKLKADRDDRLPISVVPAGVDIKTLGHDPSKQQLLETRKHLVIEFARSFANIHPAMIQDHSASTFSNTEQAAINFATTVIHPITHLIETECNVKLFSDRNKSSYVEFNMDGMMRGDLLSRYDAYAKAINAAFITPDEVREKENLPSRGGNADKLLIQGATVPLDAQPSGESE